jgi:CBS domain-containing protein
VLSEASFQQRFTRLTGPERGGSQPFFTKLEGNMNLVDISYTPALQVNLRQTVQQVIEEATDRNCDAMAVMEYGKLKGILTSRDVLLKVVLKRLDPQSTLVEDVMTAPVMCLHPDTDPEEALKLMLEKNFRHLPLSENGISVCGMLSMRKVLNFIVEDQRHDLMCMEAFLNADSPGG